MSVNADDYRPRDAEHGVLYRVIDTAGDGILAEFGSVVNAVECAVAIQQTMVDRNATVEKYNKLVEQYNELVKQFEKFQQDVAKGATNKPAEKK